jgi:hypothetical protein
MRHIRWLHRPLYAWALAVALLAGVWTAYAVQVGAIQDRAVEQAGAKANEIATAYARYVSGNLSLVDDVMRFVVAYDRDNGLERTAALATQQHLYDAFDGNIVVLDPTGTGTIINKSETGPMVLADRPYFQRAVDPQTGDRLIIGAPVSARSNGVLVLPFARGVRAADGRLIGAVAISIQVAMLEQLYDQSALGPGGVVVMTGTDDHVIRARVPHGTNFIGQTSTGSQLWTEIAKAPSGSYWQVSIIDHKQRLYAYRTLANFPIVVTAGVALDDIVAESARRGRQPRQVRIPGQHEPRAAHAAERVIGFAGAARADAARRRARACRWRSATPRRCWRSSTTSSISRRSRPARWASSRSTSTCARWCSRWSSCSTCARRRKASRC